MRFHINRYITNSMAYETSRFNAVFICQMETKLGFSFIIHILTLITHMLYYNKTFTHIYSSMTASPICRYTSPCNLNCEVWCKIENCHTLISIHSKERSNTESTKRVRINEHSHKCICY